MAALAGRAVEDLAREAVNRYLIEEARFHAAVLAGQQSADLGDFISTPDAWANVERELES